MLDKKIKMSDEQLKRKYDIIFKRILNENSDDRFERRLNEETNRRIEEA